VEASGGACVKYYYGYEAQKLHDSMSALVTARSIQERLGWAISPLSIIAHQRKSPIRERVQDIMNHMTVEDADVGSIKATCRTMSDDRAERFAKELFTLYTWVTQQNAMEKPDHELLEREVDLD
jgi:hypothetical protein